MTQNTAPTAHLIMAGRYDAERVVEIFLGTQAQAEAHVVACNLAVQRVLGTDWDEDDHSVHYGGTAPIVRPAEAEPGITTVRVEASALAYRLDQLAQDLDQIGQYGPDRENRPQEVAQGLANAQADLKALCVLLTRGASGA